MRPHQKLDLWKRSIDFVVDVYRLKDLDDVGRMITGLMRSLNVHEM